MAQPFTKAPDLRPISGINHGTIPSVSDLGLVSDFCVQRQKGGREQGLERLKTFLCKRGEYYSTDMSNPLNGSTSCSRISPHLAWGTVSMREVSHKTRQRQQELKSLPKQTMGRWPGALSSFQAACIGIVTLSKNSRMSRGSNIVISTALMMACGLWSQTVCVLMHGSTGKRDCRLSMPACGLLGQLAG